MFEQKINEEQLRELLRFCNKGNVLNEIDLIRKNPEKEIKISADYDVKKSPEGLLFIINIPFVETHYLDKEHQVFHKKENHFLKVEAVVHFKRG